MSISKPVLATLALATAAMAASVTYVATTQSGSRAGSGDPSTGTTANAVATAEATAAARPRRPLTLSTVVGGDLHQPLVSGSLVYLPSGRGVSVWDYSRPTAPRLVGNASIAPGVVQGLARHGKYLYASWRESSCRRGGVTVYSLANPTRPRQVGQVAGYAGDVERTCAAGIAVAKNRLYLFDTENDLYVGNLADPRRPALRAAGIGYGAGTRVAASGNLLWASGRSFLGGVLLRSIDISNPDAPSETAFYSSPGTDIVNIGFDAPYAYGFGHTLSVLDVSDPAQISLVGQTEMPYGAMAGVKLGDHVYTGGFHGLDVWSVAAPSQPLFMANHDLRTFSVREAVKLGADHGLMLGSDDRLLAIDARNPEKPAFASEAVQAGGVNAMDVGYVDGYAVLLQYDYGLTVADPRTLAPRARFEPPLDDDPEARAYTSMTIDGHTAYLAVWGYGLIVVDLSAPLKPREIARLFYPFASSVEVVGNRLYLGKNTNGPTLGVVDITDPSNPSLLSNWSMPDAPWAMAARGNVLFTAETGNSEIGGGVRVLDMADPGNVLQLARWEGDCESATDISLDAARQRLYVACRTGLRILDVADPGAPALVASVDNKESSTFSSVASRGDRVWFASSAGIDEFDVSVPASPRLLKRTDVAGYEPIHLRPTPDGGLVATTYSAGVHVFTAK